MLSLPGSHAPMLGNIERRLALVILTTALLPLASAMVLAYALLNYASSVWLRPEVEQELEHGIDLYKAYIHAIKDDMKDLTAAMAGSQPLREAARKNNAADCERAMEDFFPAHAQLVSLSVEDREGHTLAERDRGRVIDESAERKLEVRGTLGPNGAGPTLVATYAFDRRYERDLERAGGIHDTYAQ